MKTQKLKSGLFDSEGVEICLGDKYINPNTENGKTYTVFLKSGCFCGGISFDSCIPLAWEYNDEVGCIEECETDYIKIISR